MDRNLVSVLGWIRRIIMVITEGLEEEAVGGAEEGVVVVVGILVEVHSMMTGEMITRDSCTMTGISAI